jgi:hypothetical protein
MSFKPVHDRPMVDILLAHFQKVGNISALEAQGMFKIRSLSRRICDLKERGHVIRPVMKLDSSGQRYVRYFYVGRTDGAKALAAIGRAAA